MMQMTQHIGIKLINAAPMTRAAYNAFRGWELPANENGDDEGFLVEYQDGGQGNTEVFDGYVSWSPKAVFEKAYKQTNGMSFGHAIAALKLGYKVARTGWNGKGMWLYFVPEAAYQAQTDAAREHFGEFVPYRAYIAMKTVDNDVVPWLASQSDMLAEDWMVVA